MVPSLSIVFIAFNLLFSVALPVFLAVFLMKKLKIRLTPFLVGCAVWIIFALLLEQCMHTLVLNRFGKIIQSRTLYYALYGGLAAGIFEETGRFLAMKTLLKPYYGKDGTALMYGAGHGGVEVLLILGIGMLNNLIYAILCNTGHLELLTAPLTEAQQIQFQGVIDQLVSVSPLTFLAAPFERISAVILHIALSVLVWLSVTRKKFWMFPLAIFLHFVMDAGAVLLSKTGIGTLLTELVIFAFSCLVSFVAWKLWKRNKVASCD